MRTTRQFILFGKKGKYETFTWWENFMGGHFTINFPFTKSHITFYGENAMEWAVNWFIFGTYVCWRLPFRCFGKWRPLYFYISPNGTPSKATFKIGKA